MVFVVYKINLPDKNIYTSGVYEREIDAITQKKELMAHKTPDEAAQEIFEIHEVPLWTAKDMAKDTSPSFYYEEDNDLDETTYQEDITHIKNTLNTILKNTMTKESNTDIYEFIEYSVVMIICMVLSVILSVMFNLSINTK